jgi:hydroxymethylpyrimidine pyrophosphatase-like HAD family hydrolase
VHPLSVGRVIVATREPHESTVLEVIKGLGLELQVIFNKGAVMILPSGVNKATGLKAALKTIGARPQETVGIGDAENDHAFLDLCGCAVAVGNALPAVKDRAHIITDATHGDGVQEFIERWLAGDLDVSVRAQDAA